MSILCLPFPSRFSVRASLVYISRASLLQYPCLEGCIAAMLHNPWRCIIYLVISSEVVLMVLTALNVPIKCIPNDDLEALTVSSILAVRNTCSTIIPCLTAEGCKTASMMLF